MTVRFPNCRRLAVAWVVVVALTLLYLVLDRSTHGASTVVSVVAIGFALVKLRVILREFMDVRHAPKLLRVTTDALVLTVGVLLLGTYLVGRAIA